MSKQTPSRHPKERHVYVDAYNMLHRGYGAGNTDALGGVRSVFFTLIKHLKTGVTHMALVYDTQQGKQTRVSILEKYYKMRNSAGMKKSSPHLGYKGKRGPKPEDFQKQYDLSRELANVLGVHVIDATGGEADDVLASLAFKYREHNVITVTNDKDMFPIVSYGPDTVLDNGKNLVTLFTIEDLVGFNPQFWPDFTALKGKSDQVPGVLGIGPQQASALIRTYRSIEYLYANIDSIYDCTELVDWLKTRDLLLRSHSEVILGKLLAQLDHNIAVPTNTQLHAVKISDGFTFMKKHKAIW